MPLLSLILNILWVVTGGIWMAAGWLIAAAVMVLTIIGIPWARSALTIAWYTLLPFGQTAVRRDAYGGREDMGTGALGAVGNILWFVFAGWWLALGHLITAVGLAITIIGLPFAWAHLKLAGLALWPIGTRIVTNDEAEALRRGATYGR
ncbi:YccF domain-containing protein [Azospirillum sp.]|uniref:YccF domain-containing protein n=1 Tax=Azospirillum sp. TaxID=34012 RepID=UPI002D466E54|nr:YccF domain-containing protein [Azospirillum sp.]HYD69343.1 YccF domain-containing protein [Azospirillum sp.]